MERYQKVLLFGGIYSNYLALEEVIRLGRQIGVDASFFLGDTGGFGPHPDRSFPSLRRGGIQSLAGNYDISLADGLEDCGCGYTDPRDNRFAQISYDYTFDQTSAEHKKWLGSLPHSLDFELGNRRVHLCHGSPRRTNEFLWESATPDHLLTRFMDARGADVLCCTHTGVKWQRTLPHGRLFVNVGVIGRPENDGLTNVWATVLEHAAGVVTAEFVPVEYSHFRLAAEMRAEGLPEEFVETVLIGSWTTCLEVMPSKERARGLH